MDCFVSRNNDLRQAALDLQEQTRMQHKKGRQEREEKRLLNQEKKRIREENRKRKQQLNDEKVCNLPSNFQLNHMTFFRYIQPKKWLKLKNKMDLLVQQ